MDTRINRFRCTTAVILILFVAGFLATACGPAAPPQPTVDPATSAAALQMTEDAVRLQAHQTATAESAALIQQQTSAAQTEAARATPTSPPTATTTVTATPRPTMTPDIRPTQQYEAMKAKIDKYVKANYLVSSTGTYRRLDDYTFQWAELGYYTWEDTGYQPADFVIESDIEWSSASTSATLFNTGCGFAFHANGANDHYAVFLTMDGNVDSVSYYKGNWGHMGQGWYGKVDFPNGKAHIALVVQQDKYYFLVNDKLVKKYNGFQNKLMAGTLGYVVLSGTNKDFGTACKFSNVDLWTIKE